METEFITLEDGRYRVLERILISRPMSETKEQRKARNAKGEAPRMLEFTQVRIVKV